jgi:uncharacterized protein
MTYLPRVVDEELQRRLATMGAVLIEGPKACGKTKTALQEATSQIRLDVDERARQTAAVDPSLLLDGPTPRLIDEWQIAPEIWNHVRRAVDDRAERGQFILTGSAVPADDVTRHSGAGRIGRLLMRPMSLFESSESTADVSLGALLDGGRPRSADPGLKVADVVHLMARGGWPGHLGHSTSEALDAVRDYLGEIQRVDIRQVDGIRRDPVRVRRLLKSFARHSATYVSNRTLASDSGGTDGPMAPHTVGDYLGALERLMIVEDQPAWAPHLRSRSRIRSAPKRHFVDPSLAVAALRVTPDRLLKDLNFTGFLFESLVVRDLRIYAQANDAEVLQYRDNTGLEVDAVVEAADGRWAAFEIKLGVGRVDEAAESLLTFKDRVDSRRSGPPQALGVIVATGFGYQRPDGIGVIPIGALGP